MEFREYWQLIVKKKQTVIIITLLGTLAVLAFSLVSPLKYQTNSRLLILPGNTATDVYTLSRTNEYIGRLYAQIIQSSSFFELVLADKNYLIDTNYFSGDRNEQLKKWKETVSAFHKEDTGVLHINTYHPVARQAEQIALAINNTLIKQGANYSGTENIVVNIIDQPITSNFPNHPNLFSRALISAISFLILSLIIIYLYPEEKYDIKVFNKKKSRKKLEPVVREEKELQKTYNQVNPSSQKLDDYYRSLAKRAENNQVDLDGDIKNIIED